MTSLNYADNASLRFHHILLVTLGGAGCGQTHMATLHLPFVFNHTKSTRVRSGMLSIR
jgi:hypothetical protein